jgi:3-deoxy-D-manno-octulosonate 8-phosphate phosphatase (KDO 8-P phosphatase)
MTTAQTPLIAAQRQFDASLLLRAQNIRVVFFDVDGVLTDGGLYFAETPEGDARVADETIKRFNTLDGLGLQLLKKIGVTPAVVSGRDSRPLRHRLHKLGISHAYFGQDHKLQSANAILDQLNLRWDQAATMGDDWPDLPLMARSALAVAPANAHIEAKGISHYVTEAKGGHGAVRELCDLLLVAHGAYQRLLDEQMQGQ